LPIFLSCNPCPRGSSSNSGTYLRERKELVDTNPANLNDITEVKITELKSRKASSKSLMPPGIINGMNEDEARDLLSCIMSDGDAKS